MGDVTQLISDIRNGDKTGNGTDRLFAIVYDHLKRMASKKLKNENLNCTLHATALVNETFLKLVRADEIEWQDRLHFFRAAGQAMRRILIDKARYRRRLKRGGDFRKLSLNDDDTPEAYANGIDSDDHDRLLDLDDALNALEDVAPERAELVRLHFFAGLTLAQCADLIGVSLSTTERQWRCTRAWLKQKMA